mgnify:FL=1
MLFRSVTIHVLQGEREVASANKSLGRFDLTGIPPAPRGMPQVEVTFDIDANGILNVSAKDKASGKTQSIVIRAASGLSEDEVNQMVKDAEANSAEDKKFHELVSARNAGDNLIHASRKSLGELGDKVPAEDKAAIEAAIKDLEEVLKNNDKEIIEAKTKVLSDASEKLAQMLYGQNQGAGAEDHAGSHDQAHSESGSQSGSDHKDDAIDAEFEEVKDDKKK